MKCLYCHEDVQPTGDTCPQCGLPLIENTTLMEPPGAPRDTGVAAWMAERRPVIVAAAGGFLVVVIAGIVLLFPRQEDAEAAASFGPAPTQLASRAGLPSDTKPATAVAELPQPPPAVAAPTAPAPAPAVATSAPEPAAAPAPSGPALPAALEPPPPTPSPKPDLTEAEVPPALPDGFEYDRRWGFPPPPKPLRKPKKRPDPVIEPTPPSHTLAMDPARPRGSFVTIVPRRGTVDGVTDATGPSGGTLPSISGE